MKEKLLRGLRNIHVAKFEGSSYLVPMRLFNAKKIENKFKYESNETWADDGILDSSYDYAGGEGTIDVVGLSSEEMEYIFGNLRTNGGIAVCTDDEAPIIAILFEKKKKNGAIRYFCICNCTCAPVDISGTTIEDGKAEYEVNSINYSVGSMDIKIDGKTKQLIYHFVDSDDSTADQEVVANWYTEVQMPTVTPKGGVTRQISLEKEILKAPENEVEKVKRSDKKTKINSKELENEELENK